LESTQVRIKLVWLNSLFTAIDLMHCDKKNTASALWNQKKKKDNSKTLTKWQIYHRNFSKTNGRHELLVNSKVDLEQKPKNKPRLRYSASRTSMRRFPIKFTNLMLSKCASESAKHKRGKFRKMLASFTCLIDFQFALTKNEMREKDGQDKRDREKQGQGQGEANWDLRAGCTKQEHDPRGMGQGELHPSQPTLHPTTPAQLMRKWEISIYNKVTIYSQYIQWIKFALAESVPYLSPHVPTKGNGSLALPIFIHLAHKTTKKNKNKNMISASVIDNSLECDRSINWWRSPLHHPRYKQVLSTLVPATRTRAT
jgi:hypothetical protein